jgi:hypothetical protein
MPYARSCCRLASTAFTRRFDYDAGESDSPHDDGLKLGDKGDDFFHWSLHGYGSRSSEYSS